MMAHVMCIHYKIVNEGYILYLSGRFLMVATCRLCTNARGILMFLKLMFWINPTMSTSLKQLPNCLKITEISVVLIAFVGVP